MRELLEWLLESEQKLEYGTITLIITKHQGKMVSAEKQIVEKEKYSLTDKKK